jgi:hypothetical protein
MSEQAISQFAGVSVVTWRKHKAMGAPTPLTKEGMPAWLSDYNAWRVDNGQVPSATKKTTDDETVKWQRERMKWLAIEKRWAVAAMAKQLVPRAQVVERTTKQIMAVRQALNDMVRKLASRLFNASSPEAIEQELQQEVDHILSGFAQGLEQITDDAGGAQALQQVVSNEPSADE